MRGLKFLVIFMGVLIVIGTSLLLYLIVFKNKNIETSNFQNKFPLEEDMFKQISEVIRTN